MYRRDKSGTFDFNLHYVTGSKVSQSRFETDNQSLPVRCYTQRHQCAQIASIFAFDDSYLVRGNKPLKAHASQLNHHAPARATPRALLNDLENASGPIV